MSRKFLLPAVPKSRKATVRSTVYKSLKVLPQKADNILLTGASLVIKLNLCRRPKKSSRFSWTPTGPIIPPWAGLKNAPNCIWSYRIMGMVVLKEGRFI